MLLLIYNTVVTIGVLLTLPLLLPLAVTGAKRRNTFRQRLGWWRYPWQSMGPSKTPLRIWVHALSVGEVMAAQPLVDAINEQHSELRIVLTVSTLTGFQTASRLYAETSIDLAYFPYDLIGSVRKVADMINAKAVILVETDIWPNFLAEMRRRQVPVYLVNMRLSDGAWNCFRRFPWWAAKLFNAFKKICLQTPKDARRLIRLGVAEERLHIAGNIKFDGVGTVPNTDTRATWHKPLRQLIQRPVIVAGSTHDGEEQILLDALVALKKAGQAVHLIVAPRDPSRTPDILALCKHGNLEAACLSRLSDSTLGQPLDVIVVDFIGALKTLYGLAEVAYVGGSLANEGGHNPLEPAHFGKPVLFGPDMSDFRQIADWLLRAGGARTVANKDNMVKDLSQLIADPQLARLIGERAKQVVLQHQGAVAQTLTFIDLKSLSTSKLNCVRD